MCCWIWPRHMQENGSDQHPQTWCFSASCWTPLTECPVLSMGRRGYQVSVYLAGELSFPTFASVSTCLLAVQHGDSRAPAGGRPSTALAQAAMQAAKSHFLQNQRTLRDPQTLNQAMRFHYVPCIGQVVGFFFNKRYFKWLIFILNM